MFCFSFVCCTRLVNNLLNMFKVNTRSVSSFVFHYGSVRTIMCKLLFASSSTHNYLPYAFFQNKYAFGFEKVATFHFEITVYGIRLCLFTRGQ